MDLLDRYVQAVSSFLPQAHKDDIIKELSANLQSQMDDRSAELGRPLSEAEQAVLLQQHGHPMIVAGQYQANQGRLVFGRQLIGTTLFPFYCRVLLLTLGVAFTIYLVRVIALVANSNAFTFKEILDATFLQIFFQFVAVTCIFTVAEQYLPTRPWNPQRPPALPVMFHQGQQRPRLEAIAELVATTVFLFGVRGVFNRPVLLFGPAGDTYQLGMIWQQVAWPTALIFIVTIAQAVITLFRPTWVRFRPAVRLMVDSVALSIVVYLLRAAHWIVLDHPASKGGNTLAMLNDYVHDGLIFTTIGVAIIILSDVWRVLRQAQKRVALSQKR